jgi:hypothetical protein
MMKIKSRQDKTTVEKPFIGPDVAMSGGIQEGVSGWLTKQAERGCGKGVCTNHRSPFMQMKHYVYSSHKPSAGPPWEVLSLWPR